MPDQAAPTEVSSLQAIAAEHDVQQHTGLVAMLDALGTKGILARTNAQHHVETWSTAMRTFEDGVDAAKAHPAVAGCELLAFSDTIIVTMSGTAPDPLMWVMANLLQKAFTTALELGILLRGAVGYGTYYASHPVLIGPVVDEVADWYERANWIGVITTPSLSLLLDQTALSTSAESMAPLFVPYPMPVRDPRDRPVLTSWALNWPYEYLERINQRAQEQQPQDPHPERAIYSILARGPITAAVEAKYANTMLFFSRYARALDQQGLHAGFFATS